MGWFSIKPRLRDIQEFQPTLPGSKHIVFFLPHTSEQPTTLPLLSEVREGLCRKGRASETHSVEEMRSAVISLSLQLSRIRFSQAEKEMLDGLYRLKDACNRLAIVTAILSDIPGASLIEIQALGKDYHEEDRFPRATAFYRLPDSRVLFLKDYYGEYLTQIKNGLRTIEAGTNPRMIAARALLHLEKDTIELKTRLGLRFLMDNADRCLMLWIPSEKAKGLDRLDGATRFEREYGFGMSMRHTLGQKDVQKMIEMLAG